MFNLAGNRRLLPAAVAALLIAAGCGDETGETTVNFESPEEPVVQAPMSTYSAPGSNWQYDLHDDGTYSIMRSDFPGSAQNLSVDGTYAATATGFVSMTVDAASGTDAPGVNSKIWALEVPGYALLLSPVSTADDQFIPMVSGGECPNTDFSNNWITVVGQASGDATSPEGSYFGSLSYHYRDGLTRLTSQHALTTGNPDQGSADLGIGYCQDGILLTATSDIYLGAKGNATIRANIDETVEQTVFSLPMSTIGSIADLDGSYAGIVSDDGANPGNRVSPVIVDCNGGICAVDIVTDVDTGTMANEPFTFDLSGSINVPGSGLTTGQVHLNGGSTNLGCMVDSNLDAGGSRTISCAGQSPTRSYHLFNLILVSND